MCRVPGGSSRTRRCCTRWGRRPPPRRSAHSRCSGRDAGSSSTACWRSCGGPPLSEPFCLKLRKYLFELIRTSNAISASSFPSSARGVRFHCLRGIGHLLSTSRLESASWRSSGARGREHMTCSIVGSPDDLPTPCLWLGAHGTSSVTAVYDISSPVTLASSRRPTVTRGSCRYADPQGPPRHELAGGPRRGDVFHSRRRRDAGASFYLTIAVLSQAAILLVEVFESVPGPMTPQHCALCLLSSSSVARSCGRDMQRVHVAC